MTERAGHDAANATRPGGRLADLSRLLWDQRSLIELLEFRLEVQHLLAVSGKVERLHLAVADVESVIERIRMSEDVRLGVVAECAVELGLPVGASLRDLSRVAPEPWSFVLGDHQTALLQLVAATEELASANRELASRGVAETQKAFTHLGAAPVAAYGRHGDRPALALPPTLVDRTA